ncbi:Lsr2 family protein [Nocardioidaceae bacterium]|nr:Lsr2 family protein [Nocardioidaceae bacterium]
MGPPSAGFAVLDVETTGLSPTSDRIIEIAVIRTDPHGQVLGEWTTRLNPDGPVGATHIHGITERDVRHAPRFADIARDLSSTLAGAAVAAHNAKFDLAFLRTEYARAGWRLPYLPSLCTLEASGHHLPGLPRRRLPDCCAAIGLRVEDAHSALGDARATAALLAAFMHPAWGPPPRRQDLDLLDAGTTVSWPSGPEADAAFVWTELSRMRTTEGRTQRSTLSAQAQRNISRNQATAPAAPLVQLLERFSLVDALDEGAPEGTLAYLEKLAEVLEDYELTTEESEALAEVAAVHELEPDAVAEAHRAFLLSMASQAVGDGRISRAERTELNAVADLLAVSKSHVAIALDRASAHRHDHLGQGLAPLPAVWDLGEPLRVGDKVVFTGCAQEQRAALEEASEAAGVRVVGGVSGVVALLVTDGTMDGTKLAKARELGTRQVDPATYQRLLAHIQPARPTTHRRDTLLSATSPTPARPKQPRAGARVVTTDTEPAVIRAWARQNGYDIGERGRIRADILEAYTRSQVEGIDP